MHYASDVMLNVWNDTHRKTQHVYWKNNYKKMDSKHLNHTKKFHDYNLKEQIFFIYISLGSFWKSQWVIIG